MKQRNVRFRYDMTGAAKDGETRHPQIVIQYWFPDAHRFEPVTIADCWMFEASYRSNSPDYFAIVGSSKSVDESKKA